MVESSGVTEADLKAKIIEKLEATHVEIEDMSGLFHPAMHAFMLSGTHRSHRRLRPGILSNDSITSV